MPQPPPPEPDDAVGGDVVLARVLHEDDELLTLEVFKTDHRELTIDRGDRFLTLVFPAGKPWERDR